jgi:copper transport protein
VIAETAISVVVVALTAALVNATPPRASTASATTSAAATATATVEDLRFDIVATPGAVGSNEVAITVADNDGVPIELFELHATMQPVDATIEPLDLTLTYSGGVYRTSNFVIPLAGDYTLALRALTGPIDQVEATAIITIT